MDDRYAMAAGEGEQLRCFLQCRLDADQRQEAVEIVALGVDQHQGRSIERARMAGGPGEVEEGADGLGHDVSGSDGWRRLGRTANLLNPGRFSFRNRSCVVRWIASPQA